MSLFVAIDTQSQGCCLALYKKNTLIHLISFFEKKKHIQKLAYLFEQLLLQSDIDPKDIEALALSKGPGSYTSLRIASASVKGICFSLDIPMVALSSLFIIAAATPPIFEYEYVICAVIEGYSENIYFQYFDKELHPISEATIDKIHEKTFHPMLEKGTVIFSGAVSNFKKIITHRNAFFLPHISFMQEIGNRSYEKIQKKEFEDIHSFEPIYI